MFCGQIRYSRSFIKQGNCDSIPMHKSYCLGGSSAAYARAILNKADNTIKPSTKIALVCHLVYSIVKGLLQGAYAFFLVGNKRDIFIAHFRYNLIFPNLKKITFTYNEKHFHPNQFSQLTGSAASELILSNNTLSTTCAEYNNSEWNQHFTGDFKLLS